MIQYSLGKFNGDENTNTMEQLTFKQIMPYIIDIAFYIYHDTYHYTQYGGTVTGYTIYKINQTC